MTFHLFVCALAGAGAAVIAMVRLLQTHLFSQCIRVWETTVLWRENKSSLESILTFSWKKKRKRLLCIYVMFACETLTVDSGEKHFGAVKMKRVWLPPSVEGAACHIRCHGNWEEKLWDCCKHQSLNLSIGLVWKKRRCFLIRNDALDWHLFSPFIANFLRP